MQDAGAFPSTESEKTYKFHKNAVGKGVKFV